MTTTHAHATKRAIHVATGIDLQRWPDLARPASAPVRARIARTLLHRGGMRTGVRLELPDGDVLGDRHGALLLVNDPDAMFTRVGRYGSVGFGEAYMAREWDAPDLVAVLEPLARNVRTLVPAVLQRLRRMYEKQMPRSEDNDRAGARRNIARHYDLSNELFGLFLDETMTYSSALFEPGDELADAQRRKIDRLLDITEVRAGSTVLEIGTGWGELAMRAAARGARVTTVTLSVEQARLARERAVAAGLDDAIDVRVQDYRDVDGTYDAIVSVEMIEAVGARWWPTYFRTLDDRLRPGGSVGLQAILLPHDRMLATRTTRSWINKYVFPGGLIASERAIDDVTAAHTTLRVVDRLHFGGSYATTLKTWRERFTANAREVDALRFDETFRRLWTFYLAYSEAGFRAGYLDVAQLLMRRP